MQNEQKALELFQAMNERNFEAFESLITEDILFDFPGTGPAEGKRRALLLLKSILRKFPVLVFDVGECICSADRACVVWENQGQSLSGKKYRNRGITLIHFREGKICYLSDYFKNTVFPA